jgi:dissimilatory sulfite reductase (desulfoviridin) alpha/beta subunit
LPCCACATREGYDAGRLKRVIEALSADMRKIGFPDVSVSSRVRNIESCFAREGGADELINARLGERGLK